MSIFGFELTTSQLWLLGVSGVCIAYLFRIWLGRHSRKLAAATSFRSKFLADVGLAYAGGEWNVATEGVIRNAIPSQQLAVTEFRIFLGHRMNTAFNKAWSEYCYYCQSMNYDTFRAERMFPSMQTHTPIHPREGFVMHVNKVLSYARQT